MKHTPGPWYLNLPSNQMGDYLINDIDRSSVAQIYRNGLNDGSDEANARLIAAAPELLAACQAFVEAWQKSSQLEKTDIALRMAEKAIAHATGE